MPKGDTFAPSLTPRGRRDKGISPYPTNVLWHQVTDLDAHREQLQRLLADLRLPSVSLGIIPRLARREVAGYGVWPEETFFITDASEVNVELVSGYLSLTQPGEIAMYVAAFDRLLLEKMDELNAFAASDDATACGETS